MAGLQRSSLWSFAKKLIFVAAVSPVIFLFSAYVWDQYETNKARRVAESECHRSSTLEIIDPDRLIASEAAIEASPRRLTTQEIDSKPMQWARDTVNPRVIRGQTVFTVNGIPVARLRNVSVSPLGAIPNYGFRIDMPQTFSCLTKSKDFKTKKIFKLANRRLFLRGDQK